MLSYLRSVLWMCPMIGLSVLVMATISITASLFDPTGRLQHKVAVTWARMVLGICLVKIDVVGAEKLDPAQPYVFVANHFSLIDTPVMFGRMPRDFRIMARHGLWRIPFLGWHLNRAGHIPGESRKPASGGSQYGRGGGAGARRHVDLAVSRGRADTATGHATLQTRSRAYCDSRRRAACSDGVGWNPKNSRPQLGPSASRPRRVAGWHANADYWRGRAERQANDGRRAARGGETGWSGLAARGRVGGCAGGVMTRSAGA